MKIGIPREIKNNESRVSCTPGGVRTFVQKGHTVFVEKDAGIAIGYSDDAYTEAGAKVLATAKEVWDQADMVMKVKEPLKSEYQYLRPGLILFTYLHLAADIELIKALQEKKVVAIAYETVQVERRLPLLEPMSEIAGRMSVIVGAHYLAKTQGGSGVLLGGVPGVMPAKVLVLGGGTSGVNASRMALGLGANITIMEVNLERMRHLDLSLHSQVNTLYSNEQNLLDMLPRIDLLIGAVLLPGARAPRLVRREMLKLMRPGSVFVDIAIDQGGCAETSRATTHADPVYTEEGVVHYCVANMPGAYARTSTQALTNATIPYAVKLADLGWEKACNTIPELKLGLNICNGEIVYDAVKEALNS